MTKLELVDILKSLNVALDEGDVSSKNVGVYPRIQFFDYVWEDIMASGSNYSEVETYQVSFFSLIPRHEKLLELRNNLRKKGIHPSIYHEYTLDQNQRKCVHSYFKIEVNV